MKHVLCYGDSNTYGLSPDWITGGGGRHDMDTRWTCVLQKELGSEYQIIEEGLNGRTTVFEDPTCPNRNGLSYLEPCIESHTPLDMVILMLGTNDTKSIFSAKPAEIAAGMSRLARTALNPCLYMFSPVPKVMIVAPVPLGEASLLLPDGITDKLALEKSRQLAKFYKQTADMLGCEFLDLASVASASSSDGIHLTAEAHHCVAMAMAEKIRAILCQKSS